MKEALRRRVLLVISLPVAVALALPAAPAAASHGSPEALASAMARDAAQVTGAAFTDGQQPTPTVPNGDPHAVLSSAVAGFPTNGSTFAVLTTGDGNAVTSPNTSNRTGTVAGGSDIRGAKDVTILRVVLNVPAGMNCLALDFRFFSEEFPEFVGSGSANDGFVAELDGSTWVVTGSTLEAPNNFAVDSADSAVTVDGVGNTATAAAAAGTTYDRATPTNVAKTAITPGAHSLYLSIYDHGDALGDSAVFIDDLRVSAEAPGTCLGTGGLGGADVRISMTDSPDPVAVGATLVYTLTVTNDGPDPASGVMVSDSLPGSVSFGSSSASQGSCTGTATVVCSLGPVAFGATATVTISVTPNASGPLSNDASVSSAQPDANPTNNWDSEATTVTAEAYALTVTMAGTGAGTVTSSPVGINCPGDCSESYAGNTVVNLTANSAVGSLFAGWSGACSGTGPCSVTMDAAKSVTATFNIQMFTLTTTIAPTSTGTGTITSSPPGIDCPGDCSEAYPAGTPVSLTATPAAGSFFGQWQGACTGTGSCNVTMSANRSVTGSFFVDGQTLHTLTVTTSGTGSGSVTSSPAGIACPGDCTEQFVEGSSVNLTATPASGSTFGGWSGACTGTGPCSVQMDSGKTVTASFSSTGGGGGGGGSGSATPKQVTLKAKKKKVPVGKKAKLTVVVSPCGNHAGEIVLLKAGKKQVKKTISATCTAVFKIKIKKKTTFQAISPQQDDDHLTGMSNKVRVKILRA